MFTGVRALVARRELLTVLTQREFAVRRKRSMMLGIVWPLGAPIILAVLYTFVFNHVFSVPLQAYPVYLLSGLLPWTLFAASAAQALSSITKDGDLVRRAPFPYQLLPLTSVLANFAPFLVLIIGLVVYAAATWHVRWALLPVLAVPTVALLLFVASISLVLAIFDVFNHALRYILPNLLTAWFFLVPIVYRPEMAGGLGQVLQSVDPMNMIVGQFRDILYWRGISHPGHMVLMVVVSLACFLAANSIFERLAPQLPKEL